MTPAEPPLTATDRSLPDDRDDIAALAKGGRTNIFGFLLRLAARLPFLFIAGRWYGADALGRFAYAVLVVEFIAQIATLGLKRGLAGALEAVLGALYLDAGFTGCEQVVRTLFRQRIEIQSTDIPIHPNTGNLACRQVDV